MGRAQAGFTLIELMIVAAIVSVVASIAVPNLIGSRAAANERTIVAALRTIVTAQVQCQTRAVVDVDGDGQGEALGLDEMAGLRPLRGSVLPLSPPCLPASLGAIDLAGHTLGRGYRLAIHLPDAAGTGLVAVGANDSGVEADQAELAWTCLAWPVARGTTGSATYFVNQSGEVLVTRQGDYGGTVSVPPAGAALLGVPPTQIVGGTLAVDTVGADGNLWRLVR